MICVKFSDADSLSTDIVHHHHREESVLEAPDGKKLAETNSVQSVSWAFIVGPPHRTKLR